jgi:chromosome segregation ATPase
MKVKSFIKQFVAKIQGDDAEVQAQKALRSAHAALTTHVAIAKADLLSREEAVENAQENLANARINNGETISDRDAYVEQLCEAKNNLNEAESDLEAHKALIQFLEEELTALGA